MQIVDSNTVSFVASFDEPAVTTGAQLAYYYIQCSTNGATPVPGAHIPATPAGGDKESNLTVLANAPDGVLTTLDFSAVAVDVNGRASAPSNHVSIPVNRVVPQSPTNFTIA